MIGVSRSPVYLSELDEYSVSINPRLGRATAGGGSSEPFGIRIAHASCGASFRAVANLPDTICWSRWFHSSPEARAGDGPDGRPFPPDGEAHCGGSPGGN